MNALYPGHIMHMRLAPRFHRFHYPIFMIASDVDQLPQLEKSCRFFSYNRWNLFSIEDRDHVPLGLSGGIRPNLLSWLDQQGFTYDPNILKVTLITFPRVLGYGFFPASFFYLSERGKEKAVVVEVMNTFGEKKLFLIDHQDQEGTWYARIPKNFYVSPFSDPGLEFEFVLGPLSSEWIVKIDVYDQEQRMVCSRLESRQRSLKGWRLFWYAWKYPLLSLQIIFLIHWNAFLLWIKGTPYFKKEDRQEAQEDFYPHHKLPPPSSF